MFEPKLRIASACSWWISCGAITPSFTARDIAARSSGSVIFLAPVAIIAPSVSALAARPAAPLREVRERHEDRLRHVGERRRDRAAQVIDEEEAPQLRRLFLGVLKVLHQPHRLVLHVALFLGDRLGGVEHVAEVVVARRRARVAGDELREHARHVLENPSTFFRWMRRFMALRLFTARRRYCWKSSVSRASPACRRAHRHGVPEELERVGREPLEEPVGVLREHALRHFRVGYSERRASAALLAWRCDSYMPKNTCSLPKSRVT
jgi:hypothetical protein